MKTIRLLAIIEATTITGPAKNLLQFAQCAREHGADPAVEVAIAVFRRENQSNLFIQTAGRLAIPVYALPDGGRREWRKIGDAIRRLGWWGSVTLAGQAPSAEPYYGSADICVLSSLSEGS